VERLFHLTANGWREDPCPENERIETWSIEIEEHDAARLTRWTCVWRLKSMSAEERKSVRQRFRFPDH
jgi:hypothetical protein